MLRSIDLDPCSNQDSIVNARMELMPPANGLAAMWWLYGATAYVNPPYGRKKTGLWISKCADAARAGMTLIALVPSRTDTIWWHDLVRPTAQSICYWKGRIHFIGAKDCAPFPSALIYWGFEPHRFRAAFHRYGAIETLRDPPKNVIDLRQSRLPLVA